MAPTRYEAHLKYPYEGYLIPFGALVWYKNNEAETFAPKGVRLEVRAKAVPEPAPEGRVKPYQFSRSELWLVGHIIGI